MRTVRELFGENAGGEIIVSPGEYAGPLVVDRACSIKGNMSVIWADSGPVLVIKAAGVKIENLRVEVTGNGEFTAISSEYPDAKLINVEVRGNVKGIPGEAEKWELPNVISLGDFAAEEDNRFRVKINAAGKATLESRAKALTITPGSLEKGENSVLLTADALKDNTILYGEIMVHSAVSRRIYVMGKARAGAPKYDVLEPPTIEHNTTDPVISASPRASVFPMEQISEHNISENLSKNVNENITENTGDNKNDNIKQAKKGQRIPISELGSENIKIVFEHKSADKSIEIDGYAFLLRENGKVTKDEDLVFFGNTESPDKSVRAGSEEAFIEADLEKTEPSVAKIAVCFSVYGDMQKNISSVKDPAVRIFGGGKEMYRFDLGDLSNEKTFVAVELYRYKGEWKLNFVGAGYKSGLKKLCESYGVEVEE